MEADSGISIGELRVDGGASANNLLMQFQADLLGVDAVRPQITETTALGAAYLAGLAIGYWKNLDEVRSQWQLDRRFSPSMPKEQVKQCMAGWRARCARPRRGPTTRSKRGAGRNTSKRNTTTPAGRAMRESAAL
jgi:glycerol kinase